MSVNLAVQKSLIEALCSKGQVGELVGELLTEHGTGEDSVLFVSKKVIILGLLAALGIKDYPDQQDFDRDADRVTEAVESLLAADTEEGLEPAKSLSDELANKILP